MVRRRFWAEAVNEIDGGASELKIIILTKFVLEKGFNSFNEAFTKCEIRYNKGMIEFKHIVFCIKFRKCDKRKIIYFVDSIFRRKIIKIDHDYCKDLFF